MFVRIRFHLVFEFITRTTGAGPSGIATLDHEIGNHSMKRDPVVEFVPGQENEIVDGLRSILGEQFANDLAAGCVQGSGIFLVHIDR